jgi:hypothetical protein
MVGGRADLNGSSVHRGAIRPQFAYRCSEAPSSPGPDTGAEHLGCGRTRSSSPVRKAAIRAREPAVVATSSDPPRPAAPTGLTTGGTASPYGGLAGTARHSPVTAGPPSGTMAA